MSKAETPDHSHDQNDPEIETRYPLIGPDDPPPFICYNDLGKSPVLLVADHASPLFPAAMNQLGLADEVLDRHIAWDIGSDKLACFLAQQLNAQLILAGFSRLIVDPNRKLEDSSAFVEISDGVAIPGNLDLDEEQKTLRIQSFFKPYHDQIAARLKRFSENGIVPAMISVHTCSPVFDRVVRPWHIGIMWDKDPRIAVPLIQRFEQMEGICIGDNEPYSGRHPHDFTIDHHAELAGLPHVGIEVRQDLVDNEAGAQKWAAILATALAEILAGEGLYHKLGS